MGVVQPDILRPDAVERAARALQELRDLQRNNMDAADAVYGIARGALNVAGELQEAFESAHESSGYPASNGRGAAHESSGYPASNGRESHSDVLSSRTPSIRPNRANDHVSIGISISQSQSASIAGDPQTRAGPKGRAMAEYRQRARRQASDLTQEDHE